MVEGTAWPPPPSLPKHSQKVTVEVPEPSESAYRDDRGNPEVTESGTLLGAGVLPFTVDPDGRLLFLLGREHYVQGWRGSDNWSAFEGGTKTVDANVYATAAREYMEESLGVLHASCTPADIAEEARRMQKERDYALRVTLCIRSEDPKRPPRFHVTFVRYFPWRDGLTECFAERRNQLQDLAQRLQGLDTLEAQREELAQCPEWLCQHAALVHKTQPAVTPSATAAAGPPQQQQQMQTNEAATGGRIEILPDFLEKSQVQLWSATDMVSVVMRRYSGQHAFRSCFVRTMGVVLQEFQRRLSFSKGSWRKNA